MCFTKVWDFPDLTGTWKDWDLELLSTWKKWSNIPNLFRKIIEIKSENINLILTSEEYLSLNKSWISDEKMLVWLRVRAIEKNVLDQFDFIINRWWNNNSINTKKKKWR